MFNYCSNTGSTVFTKITDSIARQLYVYELQATEATYIHEYSTVTIAHWATVQVKQTDSYIQYCVQSYQQVFMTREIIYRITMIVYCTCAINSEAHN